MKPKYLEFCGLNSFSEPAKIDFEALLKNGVFGIFGDTGSGKSTILDAVHFALYGKVDRASQALNDCINYHSESAFVLFDFEIVTDGVRHTYRVQRERKRKNGTSKAYLYEWNADGKWAAIAEGTRDVDGEVEKIVGLSFADFKMCIALPQGDFAALVKATPSDRVKLVARLFDLDKYGERLSKAVNEKYYKAAAEVDLLKARISENEGGRVEIIEEMKTQLAKEKAELDEWERKLVLADEEEKRLLAVQTAKREYDRLTEQKLRFENRLQGMQEMRKLLEYAPKAEAVKDSVLRLKEAEQGLAKTKTNLGSASQAYEKAVAHFAAEKEREKAGNYEEVILQLSLNQQVLQNAQADIAEEAKWKEQLLKCREEYRELNAKCVVEDFDGKRAELEGKISALGDDETLLDYLKHHYKDVLLADTYGEFRKDLRMLAQEFPQTETYVQELLGKYAANPIGSKVALDIAKVNLAFKETEQKRKGLKAELEALEKRKRAFDENESKKKILSDHGAVLAKTYEEAQTKVAFVKDMGTLSEITSKIESLKKEQSSVRLELEKAQENVSARFAEKQKQEGLLELMQKTVESGRIEIERTLKENGFESVAEAETILIKIGDKEKTARECQEFFDGYGACLQKIQQTDLAVFENYHEENVWRAQAVKREAQAAVGEKSKSVGASEKELLRLQALREKFKEQEKELKEKETRQNLCDELRQLVKGNKFLEFIASEYLQEICVAASVTLLSLTGGRYFLRYDQEFRVGDNLDSGNTRSVKTLSGGETFLVSLSLALALSNTVCMNALRPIEFFFLDEGFGTLDEKLVDTVMDVLGKLSKKFAVGLISHVEELKHRIENKIVVTGATETHGSRASTEIL